jgi:hypothetical protein
MAVTAMQILEELKLEPHPRGYEGDRPLGSALYFLVTPDAHMRRDFTS